MADLDRQLDAFLAALLERAGPEVAAVLHRAEAAREALGLSYHAVKEGDVAPDFTLQDANGRPVSLAALRAQGPVVLVFFRGAWCPFCTLTLRAMERARPAIEATGARVVAVAPQARPGLAVLAELQNLHFPLLTDAGNDVARRYGLVWEVDEELRALYRRLGHDLTRLNAVPAWELPIGAGYVIAPDGHVVAARVDPHVTRRLTPARALAALRALADGSEKAAAGSVESVSSGAA